MRTGNDAADATAICLVRKDVGDGGPTSTGGPHTLGGVLSLIAWAVDALARVPRCPKPGRAWLQCGRPAPSPDRFAIAMWN